MGKNWNSYANLSVVLQTSYLTELLPDKISDTVECDVRNRDYFRTAYARTTKFQNSVINDGVRLWNNLSNDLKMIFSFGEFKRKITTSKKQNLLHNRFTRVLNLVHARLRIQCSNLNDHLYKLHAGDSPMCRCSYRCEDCDDFFLHCPLYNAERIKLLQTVETFYDPDVQVPLFDSIEWTRLKTRPLWKVSNCTSYRQKYCFNTSHIKQLNNVLI